MKCDIYGRLPTDYMDISQWKCHNCSRGTRVMKKITRYRARFEISQLRVHEVLLETEFEAHPFQGAHVCLHIIVAYT